MNQVSAIQDYVAKLKQQILDEQKAKLEFQAKLAKESELRQALQERLQDTERKLSERQETIENQELDIDQLKKHIEELEKKLRQIQDIKEKQSGFFGKMFTGN